MLPIARFKGTADVTTSMHDVRSHSFINLDLKLLEVCLGCYLVSTCCTPQQILGNICSLDF